MKMIRLSSFMIGLLLAGTAFALPVKVITAGGGDCDPASSICVYLNTALVDAKAGDGYRVDAKIFLATSTDGVANDPATVPVVTTYSPTFMLWIKLSEFPPQTQVDVFNITVRQFDVNSNPATSIDSSCINASVPGSFGNYTFNITGSSKSISCYVK